MTQTNKENFCRLLFANNAIYFADEKDHSNFEVKSGRRSPYFINFGALNFGQAIEELGRYFADAVLEEPALHNADKEPIVIFGPAYKGIPLCLTTAMALSRKEKNVFYCFNRKEEKDHGEGGSFLGHIPSGGEKVFIVDDVLTSGLSINHSIDILTKDKKIKEENIFVVVGVDRMEMGRKNKKAKDEIEQRLNKKIKCIADIRDILKVGKKDKFLEEKNIEEIENYLAEVNKELSKK